MENFCAYCGVVLASDNDFQAHCLSESHQLMIMSDEGREWKYRPPARGVPADQYTLCPMFSMNGKCRLGQQCCDAHGEDELNEWKERYGYRQMKLQHAKECSLQGSSYTEQLLEKWLTTANPEDIMKEKIDNVEVTVEPESRLTVSEKNCCREWTIRITTKATLRHVALLYENHRSHFRLSQLTFGQLPGNIKEFNVGSLCQEWSNMEDADCPSGVYICKVRFLTSIYGTFHQAIVFDFGFEPVLFRKLSVDVVSISDLEKLQQARDKVMTFTERWSSNDVTVVPFENKPYSLGESEKSLLSCYSAPEPSKFTVTQAVMEPMLTKDNYSARLHELLCIEEMTQHDLLSRYNVKAHLNIASCYLLTPNSAATAKYAHNGELFANMKLSSVLSEDSASGRLILTNCSTVLIAPAKTKGKQPRKVYEALIEDKGKTMIYIRLSRQCTEELKLLPDREFVAEVQFQLNRLPLCEMHFAVDRLHPPSLVFPSLSCVPPMLWNVDCDWSNKLDMRLNSKQREAVMAITAPISVRLPPVLIIGPFGTGKTFTLAQAVRLLLAENQSRVLVCTHSNSAADIYIRDYLHPEVAEGRIEATPLRIYYRHRWVATVHPTVLQYCLVSKTECDRSFNMPTIEDVKKHNVIVTTLSTSRYLVQLGVEKGFFTHILIDEAAQAMECEAIMPLSLANESTRIVLAGDHMQLSPEVYSQFAEDRNLHTSLLERLYDLYPENFMCKILLCENYRSHEAIIRYTSELFYDNHLIASAQQPRHDKYYPLTFFTARGEDVQDANSTAFHNNAEVYEIVERVIELKKSWPDVWGDQDEASIGVVTPYYDQVVRIRAELRKKKLHGVSVERVLNVQGKQFRVIFLSAVRTRQTCNGPKSESDLDHGFLSNARLLNTAITRAQSLVAVVGDPVSLCSVGKCRKLWEKFIHTCHKEKSLFGITWDTLRSHLDSMELKKEFTLNPLAPEFVPGRMFHGQPNVTPSSSGEYQCIQPATPPPHPWFLIPMPSPFQGPPLVQPAMPHMVPPPALPYNLGLNCSVGPSLIPPPPPTMAHHFASFPTPPALPQPTAVQPRMSSGIITRRLNSPRIPLDQSSQVKEYERNALAGRPIKRNSGYPILNNVNKQAIIRSIEERSQTTNSIVDESRRLLGRAELHNNLNALGNQIENMTNFQSNVFCAADKLNKMNVMKREDSPTGIMKSNSQLSVDIGSFNGLPEPMLMQQGMKPNSTNGTLCNLPPKTFVDADGGVFPLEMGVPPNLENSSVLQNSNQYVNSDLNNSTSMADRDRAIAAALDELLFSSCVTPQTQSFAPADRWSSVNVEAPPPSRLEAFQASLQDKLTLLEKVLPPGTDLRTFLESAAMPRAFFSHLLNNEGPVVAKRFVNLMMSIKQDQEILIRLQYYNNFLERSNSVNNLPNGIVHNTMDMSSAFPVRGGQGAPPPTGRSLSSQQQGLPNGYDPFRFESPIAISRGFTNEKTDIQRCTVNGEGKNGYVRMSPMLKSREFQQEGLLNGPVMEKSQEQMLFDMRNLSMNSRNDVNMKPAVCPQGGSFHTEGIPESVRRAELERQLREKDPWGPLAHSKQSTPDRGQDSYINKIRSMQGTSSAPVHSQPFMFDAGRRSPVKCGQEAPAQMTALSVSYPDIPDILPTHLNPNKEAEAFKNMQKSNTTQPPSSLSSNQHTPQYLFDLSVHQNNSAPLTYSQMSSNEGMTYAKILRSPHQ